MISVSKPVSQIVSTDINDMIFGGLRTQLIDWFHLDHQMSSTQRGTFTFLCLSSEYTFTEYWQMIMQT